MLDVFRFWNFDFGVILRGKFVFWFSLLPPPYANDSLCLPPPGLEHPKIYGHGQLVVFLLLACLHRGGLGPPPGVQPWAGVPFLKLHETLVFPPLCVCLLPSTPIPHPEVVLCVDILPLTHRDDYLVCEPGIYRPLPHVWSKGAMSERDFMELS